MKKKVITILLLLTFALAGAGVAFVQDLPKVTNVKEKDLVYHKNYDALYQCSHCLAGKSVKVKLELEGGITGKVTPIYKAPSNTGVCKKNPRKLDSSHNYVFKNFIER